MSCLAVRCGQAAVPKVSRVGVRSREPVGVRSTTPLSVQIFPQGEDSKSKFYK